MLKKFGSKIALTERNSRDVSLILYLPPLSKIYNFIENIKVVLIFNYMLLMATRMINNVQAIKVRGFVFVCVYYFLAKNFTFS